MSTFPLPNDPLWLRASRWITPATPEQVVSAEFGIIGVPAHLTSISPSDAHLTPDAIRGALARYSTYSASRDLDVARLTAVDFGDVEDPDGREGEARVRHAVAKAASRVRLLVALGGDNSITYSVVGGLFGGDLSGCGLITIDAHHDLRDGETNGSPVRRLMDAGLPGDHIVQVGIADFSNSADYAKRARDAGIRVIPRSVLRERPLADVAAYALDAAGAGGRPIFVDVDVDVCDRAEVPACHAAAPGGLAASELRHLVNLVASDSRVRGIDIAEIDAPADADDGRTLHLGALLVLEAAAGLAARSGSIAAGVGRPTSASSEPSS